MFNISSYDIYEAQNTTYVYICFANVLHMFYMCFTCVLHVFYMCFDMCFLMQKIYVYTAGYLGASHSVQLLDLVHLYQIFAFRSLDVVFMVLSYLIWSASRNILEAPYLMLCCVLFFMSGAKLVFDLVFVVLSCVIFSTSASFV